MLYQPLTDGNNKMYDLCKGEYMWYLGFEVEDLEEAIEYMKERNFEMIVTRHFKDGSREAVFDTSEIGGLKILCHEIAKGSALKNFIAFK